MSKNLGEVINNIMEENASNRALILTNTMMIVGTIHNYEDKCKNCHECVISLKDVSISLVNEVCHCSEDECNCNTGAFAHYNWFNINADKIVGFSILSDM
ncbi:hypothetical protein IJ541_01295 [bacterium]|nr:hypothetical protein [bacterium]